VRVRPPLTREESDRVVNVVDDTTVTVKTDKIHLSGKVRQGFSPTTLRSV
jgi:hypothetical protein